MKLIMGTPQKEIPLGSIVSWLENLTGVGDLPDGWQRCNGDPITGGPLDGENTPNLNGKASTKRFLRGSEVSGNPGGEASHDHGIDGTQFDLVAFSIPSSFIGSAIDLSTYGALSGGNISTAFTTTLPPYYEVVYIMRVT